MKILLVDDSKSARYALRLQLQRHGIEVETADCAESAFDWLKTQLPDAILMDHMMPGLNGFEALEVIREDPRTAAIPVIMCTSHEEPDFVATANKKGVFGILPKSAAAELLPGILDRLRERLPASVAPAAAPPVAPAAPPAVPAAPAAPAWSEDALTKLIDARVEARLARLLTPMLEELRHDLTESLSSQSRRFVEERFATERQNALPAITMADLQVMSTRLATETLPDLFRREIEVERASLMASIDRQLLAATQSHPVADALPAAGQSEASEESLTLKATAIARREAQNAVDDALKSAQQTTQDLERSLRSAINALYALTAVALLVGLGAAGGVAFFLLRAA